MSFRKSEPARAGQRGSRPGLTGKHIELAQCGQQLVVLADPPQRGKADAVLGSAVGGMLMQGTEDLVGDAVGVARLGFDDDQAVVYPAGTGGIPEHQATVDGHPFAALLGDQRRPAVAHPHDRLQHLLERAPVEFAVGRADLRLAAVVQHPVLFQRAGHATLLGLAALALQLDLGEAQPGVDVPAHADLAALPPATMVVEIAGVGRIVEIAGVVEEIARPVDLEHVELPGQRRPGRRQALLANHVLVVAPDQHRGGGVEPLEADGVEQAVRTRGTSRVGSRSAGNSRRRALRSEAEQVAMLGHGGHLQRLR